MRIVIAGLVLMLTVAPLAAQTITAAQIADGMGLSAGDKKKLAAGEIVSTDVEESNEKELAAALALVVPAALDEIAASITKGTTLDANSAILAHGEIDPAQVDEAAFAGVTLPDSEVAALLDAEPGSEFNLSTEEFAVFEDLGKQYKPGDAGAADAVNAAYRQMLAGRMQAYLASGLEGIAPYDRGGDSSSPADDLKAGLEAATLLEQFAPQMYQAFLAYPDQAVSDVQHQFHWSQQEADDRPVTILTHRMLQQRPDVLVLLSRDYYVGHSFNASQAVAGALPVDGGTAIFYGNRTSTDQVAGFGGSLKRKIGGGMMRDSLIATLKEVRKTWQP